MILTRDAIVSLNGELKENLNEGQIVIVSKDTQQDLKDHHQGAVTLNLRGMNQKSTGMTMMTSNVTIVTSLGTINTIALS